MMKRRAPFELFQTREEFHEYRRKLRARGAILIAQIGLAKALLRSLFTRDTDRRCRDLWTAANKAWRRLEDHRIPR